MFLADKQELSSLVWLFNRSFDLPLKSLFVLYTTEKDFANFLAYLRHFLLHFADGGFSRLSSSRSFSRAYTNNFARFFKQAAFITSEGFRRFHTMEKWFLAFRQLDVLPSFCISWTNLPLPLHAMKAEILWFTRQCCRLSMTRSLIILDIVHFIFFYFQLFKSAQSIASEWSRASWSCSLWILRQVRIVSIRVRRFERLMRP